MRSGASTAPFNKKPERLASCAKNVHVGSCNHPRLDVRSRGYARAQVGHTPSEVFQRSHYPRLGTQPQFVGAFGAGAPFFLAAQRASMAAANFARTAAVIPAFFFAATGMGALAGADFFDVVLAEVSANSNPSSLGTKRVSESVKVGRHSTKYSENHQTKSSNSPESA